MCMLVQLQFCVDVVMRFAGFDRYFTSSSVRKSTHSPKVCQNAHFIHFICYISNSHSETASTPTFHHISRLKIAKTCTHTHAREKLHTCKCISRPEKFLLLVSFWAIQKCCKLRQIKYEVIEKLKNQIMALFQQLKSLT